MTAEEEEDCEREGWGSHLDYFLSSMGYAVGLGNVWRFPYLTYRNGGASFLIPYFFVLFMAGLPLFFLEASLGQFTSCGAISCWQMAPIFAGIGTAMLVTGAMVSFYYNMLIAYAIYYMFASFVSLDEDVPWKDCHNEWNTPACRRERFPDLGNDQEVNASMKLPVLWDIFYNKSCVSNLLNASHYEDFTNGSSPAYNTFISEFRSEVAGSSGDLDMLTWDEVKGQSAFRDCVKQYTTPSEEYFERQVLGLHNSPDFDDLGSMNHKLVGSLALAWLLIFGCILKGIKTSGKVVYFTALFPYVVLTALLIKGLTLSGYEDGLDFYMVPEWDELRKYEVWGDAANQIFYSLGISFGGQLTMASYSKFRNNCRNDAVIVALINCGTSVYAGLAIFCMLGHMAHVTGKDVEDVATSGPGLAFIAYPDGISRISDSPIWGFLFFLMLVTLGMDSQFAMIETLIAGLSDVFPRALRKRKTLFTGLVCLIGFLGGLPQCYDGGIRILTLLDDYAGSYNLFVVAFFETICISYVYGLENFLLDIEMMLGYKPGPYWKATWGAITPVLTIAIIVVTAEQHEGSSYDGQSFPDWADTVGWSLCWFPILCMVVVATVQFYKHRWPGCVQPTRVWGPALPSNRTGRYSPLDEDGGEVGVTRADSGDVSYLSASTMGEPPYDVAAVTPYKTTDVANHGAGNHNGYGSFANGNIYDTPYNYITKDEDR